MNIDDDTQVNRQLAPQMVKDLDLGVRYDGMIKVAQLMAKAQASLPKHLHGNPGECLAIIMMSLEWKMNPWMVGQKTSVINGRLMYEGQLVAAIINNSGALKNRFKYDFRGEGNERICICTGTLKGEDEERSVEVGMPSSGEATNSPLWKGSQMQKDQQLTYKAARVWVRRHAPEVLLGVYTAEDDWTTLDQPPSGESTVASQQDAFTMKALENKPTQAVDFSQMGAAKKPEPVQAEIAANVTEVQTKFPESRVAEIAPETTTVAPIPTVTSKPKEKTTAVQKDEWSDLADSVDKKPEIKNTSDLLESLPKPCGRCKGKGSVNFQEQDPTTGEVTEGVEPCQKCKGAGK